MRGRRLHVQVQQEGGGEVLGLTTERLERCGVDHARSFREQQGRIPTDGELASIATTCYLWRDADHRQNVPSMRRHWYEHERLLAGRKA